MKQVELPTYLAQTMMNADNQLQYDEASKKAMADKYILAWILKKCVKEFRRISIKDIRDKYIEGEPQVGVVPVMPDVPPAITGIGTEDGTVNEGTVRFDIRFVAVLPGNGEKVEIIVNLEAQARFRSEYPLMRRVIYYGCRLISGQYGTVFTKQEYGKLKKCYTIWVVMNPPKARENTITSYSFSENHIVGHFEEDVKNYDLVEAVMICLGKEDKDRYDDLLNLLGTLLSEDLDLATKKEVLERDFDIPMSETLESEVSQMCNLSESLIEKGEKRGIEKGEKRGEAKGEWRKAVKIAKTLLGMELSYESIAETTELPVSVIQDIVDGKDVEWGNY